MSESGGKLYRAVNADCLDVMKRMCDIRRVLDCWRAYLRSCELSNSIMFNCHCSWSIHWYWLFEEKDWRKVKMNGREFSITELKVFFKTMNEIEKRIEEIAPLCTNITSREDITRFSYDEDGSICIRMYSSDCGNDAYWFPIDYLTMDNERIKKCKKEKAELAMKLRKQEELKEKKERERKERMEYERLKRKFEVH